MMTPHNRTPQPIPMFSTADFRRWGQPPCEHAADNVVFFAGDKLPPFLIVRDSSAGYGWTVKLFDMNGNVTNVASPDVRTVTVDGIDYVYPAPTTLGVPIPSGRYYMQVTDNEGDSYFSEWFNITSCPEKLLLVEWSDNCTVLGIPYGEMKFLPLPGTNKLRTFTWYMYLDTPITPGVAETEKTEEDGGNSRAQRISTLTKVKNTLSDVFAPHVIECFHAMMHHSSLNITRNVGGTDYTWPAEVDTITEAATSVCVQRADVVLLMGDPWKTHCCNGPQFGDVQADCFPCELLERQFGITGADAAFFVAQPVGTDGFVLDAVAPWTSVEGWTGTVDPGPTVNFYGLFGACVVRVATDKRAEAAGQPIFTDRLFAVWEDAGSPSGFSVGPWCQPPQLSAPGGGVVELLINPPAPPIGELDFERFVEVEATLTPFDPGTWVAMPNSRMLESELTGDPYMSLWPAGSAYFRVRYYTHNCDYGYSDMVEITVV